MWREKADVDVSVMIGSINYDSPETMYRLASDRIEACRVGTKDAPPMDTFCFLGDSIYPALVHG